MNTGPSLTIDCQNHFILFSGTPSGFKSITTRILYTKMIKIETHTGCQSHSYKEVQGEHQTNNMFHNTFFSVSPVSYPVTNHINDFNSSNSSCMFAKKTNEIKKFLYHRAQKNQNKNALCKTKIPPRIKVCNNFFASTAALSKSMQLLAMNNQASLSRIE